ncbi:MAG: elongation factor G [Acidimicrobiales bacterium]
MAAVVPSSRIRNVALIGHDGAGKTTLTEALLFANGAIPKKGRVEDGNTVSDFEPEEQKHRSSIATAVAPFEFGEYKINLLDTPGIADFVAEVEMALAVADLAVVVVSGVEGVEVDTKTVWRLAEQAGLPRIVFVNKLDRERSDFDRTLEELREAFGSGIAPLELPIGSESNLHGVVEVLADSATVYENGHPRPVEIPEALVSKEHDEHDHLVEELVVGDDELMASYLDGVTPGVDVLEETLAQGVANRTVFPVICGSAMTGIALDRLAGLICEIPVNRTSVARAGDRMIEIPSDSEGEPLARVCKTVADPFVGKISLLHVLSGTLRLDMVLSNTRTHSDERLHGLEFLVGRDTVPVAEVRAGDIVAVPKLASLQVGDVLAPKSLPVVIDSFPCPPAMLSIAVRPKTQSDEDRLMTGLHRLVEEDAALVVRRDGETHQTVLSGMGETHLLIACERLRRRFGVEIEREEVKVPYRETITAAAEAEGKHKKQSGGHGQFAVVHLRVEPLARGEGFVFVDAVVGGAIPRPFIPAVEKGVRHQMQRGGVFGFPVVDVKVTCDGGKFHAVDSNEMSFELAAASAFSEAIAQAGPVLLEPISKIEVHVPSHFQGGVLGDLNARRGRVIDNQPVDTENQMIVALVPESEVAHYVVDLRSLTGGQGRFTSAFDHHVEVSANAAEKLSRRGAMAV